METKSVRTTKYVGHERVYLYERSGADRPYGAAFTPAKITWFSSDVAREKWIKKNMKHARVVGRQYNAKLKSGEIECSCGCKQKFVAFWTTRRPAYLNDWHHKRKLADDRKARRNAKMKAALAAQRTRRLNAKLRNIQPAKKSKLSVVGEQGRESEGGGIGAIAPPLGEQRGLFANTPEPEKSKKRSKRGLPTVQPK